MILIRCVSLCVLLRLAVCLGTVPSENDDPRGRRRRAESRFRVGPNWDKMNFSERWNDFQSSVPFSRFQGGEHPGFIPDESHDGLMCVPWIWGPETAENLIILIHGFLSCSGRWGLLVNELLGKEVVCGVPGGTGADAPRPCGPYRIMSVTLPGHGYKWSNVSTRVHQIASNSSGSGSVTAQVRDDIDDMPFRKNLWFDFDEALGALAQSFKEEHPRGTVAIVGHSIGGVMAMHIAIGRPTVFDRVLVQNPELGPSNAALYVLGKLGHLRLSMDSLGESCEARRLSGKDYSGGNCQFKLGHINSVWSFAKELYCKTWQIARCTMTHWSFDAKAYNETRKNFSLIKTFQMVATRADPAVEEKRILTFMQELDKIRTNDNNVGLCTFPHNMGHTYLVPTFVHKHPGGERWWAPYAMDVLVRYLVEGRTVPVVVRTGTMNWKKVAAKMNGISALRRIMAPRLRHAQRSDHCLPDSPRSVVGTDLTILPAAQNDTGYFVAGEGGTRAFAKVLFHGSAKQQSDNSSARYDRQQELLLINERLLLVGRWNKDARIDDLHLIRRSATASDSCIVIGVEVLNPNKPLLEEIDAVHGHHRDTKVTLCQAALVRVICNVGMVACTKDTA